ncbi:hypothetical protein, conserved [Leishmania tarentolae]|uniref:Uncharacterized protein n=1 Tax=Leishmania tarentolae TaxID=5689 RepID=A0A640KP07_LEITA|nr:hypothetical protein, conserved [Leishmania tarentolae]
MGCHTSHPFCTNAHDTAAATGASTQLSTYTGAPLGAVVAYERAALRQSHDLNHLRRSAETTTKRELVHSTASLPTGRNGPATASQPSRRPLLRVCINVQRTLRQQHEQRQHHSHADKGKEAVAEDTAYQDGVPVWLQELAWEWRSSAAQERERRTGKTGRSPTLSAEQMLRWRASTAELLYAYVRSRQYKKALQRARNAAATGARGRAPAAASATRRDEDCRSDGGHGAPKSRVFRALFKSYAELGRSLTTSHRAAAGAASSTSSSATSTRTVTPSMWCAVLCGFVGALPEPLMPSLCSRRLEPFAGTPPSESAAATTPTLTTHATCAAVRRVVAESFISTGVVSYVTFCYVLDLVHEHRAELTGEEVEAVAKAIVREPSLTQTTREVAYVCDPEARMFWPPRTSLGASSTVAPTAMVREKVSEEEGSRLKGVSVAGGGETGVDGPLAEARLTARAAVEVKVRAPSTAPAAAGGGMRLPPTSSSSTTGSEENGTERERGPPAAAACAIPAAAQQRKDMPRASPVPQQGSSKAEAAPVSHQRPDQKGRLAGGREASPLKDTPSVGESSSLMASEHSSCVVQHSAKQLMSPSENKDTQVSSVLASRPDLTALSMSKLNSALCPSAVEDLAAVKADAEDWSYVSQQSSESSLCETTSILSQDDSDGDGIYPRYRGGGNDASQRTSLDKVSASVAPVPSQPPPLSPSHCITLASPSSPREECYLLPKFGGAAAPTSPIAVLPAALPQKSTERLPSTAFRAQAEQPLLTALMVSKQRFLAALRMTPTREAAATLPPTQTAERMGPDPAGVKDRYESSIDHRLERVMACAREMGWTSLEGFIESLKAAQWRSLDQTPTNTGAEAAALSSPHAPVKPGAFGSSSHHLALPHLSQARTEAVQQQAQKCSAVPVSVPGLMGSSNILAGANSCTAECRSGHSPESQQPNASPQVGDACHAFPSSQTESDNSVMRVESTGALCSGIASQSCLQGDSLLLPPADEISHVAGTGRAHISAPLRGHEGLTSSCLTNPSTGPAMSTSGTANYAATQPLSELEQELTRLRHLVGTLESKQSIQAHQSSVQASELQARCLELQYQQIEQAKQLRVAREGLMSVGKELESLLEVKAHLQMQLAVSQQEGTRLRSALLLDEARARGT